MYVPTYTVHSSFSRKSPCNTRFLRIDDSLIFSRNQCFILRWGLCDYLNCMENFEEKALLSPPLQIACRVIGLLQATSVFVSTISITAIALDRRRLIVGSEQESPQDMGKVVATIPIIWATAVAMARWDTLIFIARISKVFG